MKSRIFLLDFKDTAKNIHATVRACNPHFTCMAKVNNLVLEILEVSITSKRATNPGDIFLENSQVLISCCDLFIKLEIVFSKEDGFFSGSRFSNFFNLK